MSIDPHDGPQDGDSGNDAAHFFARVSEHSDTKFVHLNRRRNARGEATPYDLVVVSQRSKLEAHHCWREKTGEREGERERQGEVNSDKERRTSA